MRRCVAVIVTLLLATAGTGCGSGHKSAAPPTTAPTPATLPLGVGQVCAEATRQVLLQVHALGRNGIPRYDGKSPLYKALIVSLNDCSSRIEWLSALHAEDPGGSEDPVTLHSGRAARWRRSSPRTPIPVACKNP